MDDFAKMDIFFMVTTVAVVLLALLVGYAIYRLIRILRYLESISKNMSEEAALIRGDIATLRQNAVHEGFKLIGLLPIVRRFVQRIFTRGRKNR